MDEHRNNVGDGAQVTHPEQEALSVSEVLSRAADLLEKPGAWTQGCYARDEGGKPTDMWGDDPVCFCVSASIQKVEGRHRSSAWNRFDGYTRRRGFRHMADFNDHPGRTQAEVVSALRAASEVSK